MRPGDFSPGNQITVRERLSEAARASMRPGDFSPGNSQASDNFWSFARASMRPGDFSPGNPCRDDHGRVERRGFNEAGGFLPRKPRPHGCAHLRPALARASMRPGDFSPGNRQRQHRGVEQQAGASMRPGDFSPGNSRSPTSAACHHAGFNEAGGFLPRKPRGAPGDHSRNRAQASMRPGDFSPGNPRAPGRAAASCTWRLQ